MNVTDLEDLSHSSHAQAVEDLVLAIDQTRGIRPLKTGDAFRAMRALFERAVDGLLTFETGDLGHGLTPVASLLPQDIAARRIGAEAHDVARLELRALHARVVHERSVRGLQIFQDPR